MTCRWRHFILLGMSVVFLGTMPANGESDGVNLSEAIIHAKQATVGVLQFDPDAQEHATKRHFSIRGSGVHIRDGYILTARHAVERTEGGKVIVPKTITVLTGTLDELPATLIGIDAFLDLAVYRLNHHEGSSPLPPATFGSHEPNPGDEVFTVGYPLGWGPALGFGRVGNPNTFLPTAQTRLIQVDLSACSGNSGGGLFNTKGEIVGMVHAIIQTETTQAERRCSRFAFAVPGPLVSRMGNALIQGTHAGFSRLGIQMTAVKVGTQWHVAVAKAKGPARKGGLRKGDIILSIEGTVIRSASQLKNYLIERTQPGQRITIKVARGETEKLLYVTLGKG